MSHSPNLISQKFGRLTVIAKIGPGKTPKKVYWLCRCECGGETVTTTGNLRSGFARSCGCLQKERAKEAKTTHGLRYTAEYKIWLKMKDRCLNPANKDFADYVTRGVCERWLNSFEAFYEDMGPRPTPKHTLERLDNNLGYSPDNCVWATQTQQAQNKRTTIRITFQGKTLCLAEWSRILNIGYLTLLGRLRAGWPVEKAFTIRPVKQTGKLTTEMVKEIRSRVAGGEPQVAVAIDLGISKTTVWEVVSGRTWRHVNPTR